jgi:hypothetical protein
MSDVDLIAEAYRTSLGREASPEELQGWVSGQYGGGSVQDRINQIAGSHEAQQRNPQPPQAPVIGTNPNVSRPVDPPPSAPGVDRIFGDEIGSAYQQYLGRQASPDEISNWWSGQFGYGSGMSGLGSFREAIRNSPESRTRAGGQAPPVSYQDTMYWNSQGVPNDQIFDSATGQLRPGWQRTARGYERIGGAQGGTGGGGAFGSQPLPADPRAWFMQLTGGRPPSPQALAALEPQLNQYGIRLGPKNGRGWSDTIIMPDGTVYDVIQGATDTGGQAWSWFVPSPHAGGVGGGPAPGNQYSDPYTAFLESLIKSRIGSLQGGYDDSARQQYQQALQGRAAALGQGNAQLDQLLKYLQERFTDLKGPGYTGAEQEVLRTGALDPMERDRTAARQRLTERLAAMGHTPESGVFQDAMRRLDSEFDGMRGITQTQLATNELGRRENRSQRAEMIGSQIADIPDQRAREQLDVFGALERLSLLARQEDESRSREAISYGGVLSDLGPQRMQLAMQAAGMGGNPAPLSNTLMGIAGMNQQGAMYNQSNQNSLWSGLGTIAAIIARSGNSGLSNYGI